MQINTNVVLKNMQNESLMYDETKKIELTLGKAIANILLTATTEGISKLKYYSLSTKFFGNEESQSSESNLIDVDAADLELVKTEIGKATIYNTIVTGQLLSILANLSNA